MTDHFVKLSCVKCGQALDVYDDMERFFCGNCGAGMAVERRGGTVILVFEEKMTLADASSQPGAGNAAELPYSGRFKEDAQNLSKQRDEIMNQRTEQKKRGFVLGAALLLGGYVVVKLGIGFVLGLGILLAGIVVIVYVRRKDKSVLADVRLIEAKIDALSGRMV
jgi:ribosomal protein S27AE